MPILRMTLRNGSFPSALLTCALGLLACATPAPPPPGDQPAPQMEPQSGGVLQAASNPVPGGLYWFDQVAAGGGGHRAGLTPAFENLITYQFTKPGSDFQAGGSAGKLAPQLAESWKQTDPKTYEFTLRKGVKWHDGEEFSAKDVLWSIEQWGQPIAPGDNRTLARSFESVEAMGPSGVRMRLKNLDPEFLPQLADFNPKILPAHIAEKAGNPTGDALRELYNKTAVGTGPFKWRTFDRTKHMELERFDGYWGGRPYLEGFRIFYRIDRSAQQAGFIVGNLDFVTLADKVQYDTVAQSVPGTQKVVYVAYMNPGVVFNFRRKPWDDIRVRRAMHLAVDRQALESAVSFGEGFIGGPSPVIPSLTRVGVGMQPDEYLKLPGWRQPKEQDVAEAKRLLADAGYAGGLKTIIKYRQGSTGPTRLTEPVASQLKNIGLDVTVQSLEDGVYLAQVERDKDFDLRVDSGVGGSLTPTESAYTRWHSTGADNASGINDPELDRLTEAARAEVDDKKRQALFTAMQRRILENVYYIPLPTAPLYQALQPWLHEFYGSFSANVSILNARATWLEVDRIPEGRRRF